VCVCVRQPANVQFTERGEGGLCVLPVTTDNQPMSSSQGLQQALGTGDYLEGDSVAIHDDNDLTL
jgi:hypothetical protein